jgi:hypothetical protein
MLSGRNTEWSSQYIIRMDTLLLFNDQWKPDERIPSNKEILLPIDALTGVEGTTRQLCAKDLDTFHIESRCMDMENYPVFWVYYCTAEADVLGKLVMANTEMIFEPLNDNFKGFYNYDCTCTIMQLILRCWVHLWACWPTTKTCVSRRQGKPRPLSRSSNQCSSRLDYTRQAISRL